ncbi:MAG: LytTR family DNA-binding domain-containing protein [Maribacter sp.]
MKLLSCCLIGSSELQKIHLKKLIIKSEGLEFIKSYNSVMKAIDYLMIFNIDLIFLNIDSDNDINFEVLNHINQNTQIIVTSSKPDYALKAFEYGVVDYLLQPLRKERFEKAIEKVKKNSELLTALSDKNQLIVRSDFKEVKLYTDEIKWIEALGDYIKIVTKRKNIIVLSSMKAFYKRLPQSQFSRIHKSYIVNISMIDMYNHKQIEIGGYELPLSRTKNLELDEVLNLMRN